MRCVLLDSNHYGYKCITFAADCVTNYYYLLEIWRDDFIVCLLIY